MAAVRSAEHPAALPVREVPCARVVVTCAQEGWTCDAHMWCGYGRVVCVCTRQFQGEEGGGRLCRVASVRTSSLLPQCDPWTPPWDGPFRPLSQALCPGVHGKASPSCLGQGTLFFPSVPLGEGPSPDQGWLWKFIFVKELWGIYRAWTPDPSDGDLLPEHRWLPGRRGWGCTQDRGCRWAWRQQRLGHGSPGPEHTRLTSRLPTPEHNLTHTLNTRTQPWCQGRVAGRPGAGGCGQKAVAVGMDGLSGLRVGEAAPPKVCSHWSPSQRGVSGGRQQPLLRGSVMWQLPHPGPQEAEGPRSALTPVAATGAPLHSCLVLPGPRPDVASAVGAVGPHLAWVALEHPVRAGAPEGQGLCPPEHLEVGRAAGSLPAGPWGATVECGADVATLGLADQGEGVALGAAGQAVCPHRALERARGAVCA